MGQNILIIEQNDIFRAGLRTLFMADPRVASVYEETSMKNMSVLQTQPIDLILVNRALIADTFPFPNRNTVIIVHEHSIAALKEAYDYGAIGYMTNNVSESFLRALLQLKRESFLLEPDLTPLLMNYLFDTTGTSTVKDDLLTPREREIVQLLRMGIDRKSIAKKLHIAPTTLKTHMKNIAHKREPVL
jgi:DNA-binding NarL/FixJ family response regulator